MIQKNIDYWKELVKNAPKEYLELLQSEKEFLNKSIKRNSKVLEVGCGDGRSLRDIIPLTNNLIGIDHDKKAVENAKQNLKNAPQVKIIQADGINLPFQDKTFDYTLCLMTFSNLAENKLQILREMKMVTKKEGFVLISCYSEDSLPVRLQMYQKLEIPIKETKEDGKVIFDNSLGDNISEHFDREKLKNIFLKAGLEIEEIEKKGIGYFCRLSVK